MRLIFFISADLNLLKAGKHSPALDVPRSTWRPRRPPKRSARLAWAQSHLERSKSNGKWPVLLAVLGVFGGVRGVGGVDGVVCGARESNRINSGEK